LLEGLPYRAPFYPKRAQSASTNPLPDLPPADKPVQETGPSLPSPLPPGPGLSILRPSPPPTVSQERQAVSASATDYSFEDFIFLPSQIEPVGKLTSTSRQGESEVAKEAVLYPRYTVKGMVV